MKKIKLLIISLLIILAFPFCSYAYGQEKSIKIFINNNELSFDNDPVIKNGYTLVPMRAIFTTLGYNVYWDDS